MEKFDTIIASHAGVNEKGEDVHGPVHNLDKFLTGQGIAHLCIKHPLRGDFSSWVGNETPKERRRDSLIKQTFYELKFNWDLTRRNKPLKLFVGIDPLNAFTGVLAKKLGWVGKIVFYTPDYTEERFNNPLINFIYHAIDRFCVKNADQVWNVSSRIVKVREKQGLDKSRNFFVPNSVDFDFASRLPQDKIRKEDLVIVTNLNYSIDYPMIIHTIFDLSKEFPKIRLLIIGSGEAKAELENLTNELGLSERIIFYGQQPHEKVMEILSKAGIGLALYSGRLSWNYYGDSMKAREYMASGLPVLITDVVSTADDVRNNLCGKVIKLEKKSFKNAVREILQDDALYAKMRKNAIETAKKFDMKKIYQECLSKLK